MLYTVMYWGVKCVLNTHEQHENNSMMWRFTHLSFAGFIAEDHSVQAVSQLSLVDNTNGNTYQIKARLLGQLNFASSVRL